MKVLVAGASGAIGRQLVPHLVAAGHDVVGLDEDGAVVAGLNKGEPPLFEPGLADLVAQGHLARDQMASTVEDLIEQSRRRREDLRKLVQHEVQRQLGAIGLATKADLAALERRLSKASRGVKKAPAKTAAKKDAKTTAKRAKKTAAKTASNAARSVCRRIKVTRVVQ